MCVARINRDCPYLTIDDLCNTQCELYDLASDPQALYNLYGSAAAGDLQRDLETQLLTWLVQSSDVTPFDTDPRGYA